MQNMVRLMITSRHWGISRWGSFQLKVIMAVFNLFKTTPNTVKKALKRIIFMMFLRIPTENRASGSTTPLPISNRNHAPHPVARYDHLLSWATPISFMVRYVASPMAAPLAREMVTLSRFFVKRSSQRQNIVLLAMVLTAITMQIPPGSEETKKWSHWNEAEYQSGCTLPGA